MVLVPPSREFIEKEDGGRVGGVTRERVDLRVCRVSLRRRVEQEEGRWEVWDWSHSSGLVSASLYTREILTGVG